MTNSVCQQLHTHTCWVHIECVQSINAHPQTMCQKSSYEGVVKFPSMDSYVYMVLTINISISSI